MISYQCHSANFNTSAFRPRCFHDHQSDFLVTVRLVIVKEI